MVVESPKDWKLLKLNDIIVDIIDYRGKTPKKLGGDWSESGIIALSAMNVKQGQLVNLEKAKFVSEELYRKWMKSEVRQCDILMTSEAPLGETYFVAQRRKICLSQRLYCIRANPDVVQPRWLFYALSSQSTKNQLNLRATGTTVLGIRQPDLREIPITVPPLPTQRKIAAILGNYDDLIENNARRIEILEEMAGTIYREWFIEFRFPGHENVKMVESEMGLIPQGWEIVKLSDIVELTRKGITPSKFPEEIFAHYSIPAFDSEGLPMLDAGDTIKSSKYVVPPDCVLISKLNPQIPRVWLPFINTVHRPIASTEFLIIKPKSLVDCVHLFHLFQSPEFSREFSVQRLGTSRSHQRVSPEGFLGMSVLLPNESLLNEFHEKVNSIVNLCNTLRLKNTNLRQTRDLLLPKLISGELDVSDLDIGADLYRSQEGEKSYAA